MGLPGSLPIGMPVSLQSMGMLGGFPAQMWASAAAGQQYAGGLVNPSQLHELYGGGGAGLNGVEVPPPAHNQQGSSGTAGDSQSSVLYRSVTA